MPSRTPSRPPAPRRHKPRTEAADKAALDAPRRSEARYRALAETTSDFIWEMDASGRYTYCSPQMEVLWGIKPSDMIGKTPFDVMPAADRAAAVDRFREMSEHPRPFKGVRSAAYDAAGRLIHIEASGVPFFADDGTLLGFRGTTRDITEQKRLESEAQKLLAAVRAEKERLAALVSSIRDEVWFVDASRRLTLLNPSVPREAQPPDHPLDASDVAQSYEVLRRDGSPRPPDEAPPLRALKGETLDCVEEIVRTPGSGELRYREVTASPVRDAAGEIVGSVSIVRDVTRRKRAEEALRESEARFRALAETSPLGVGVSSSEAKLIYVNGAYERILGWEGGGLLGQPAINIYFDPAERDAWLAAMHEKGNLSDYEVRLKRKDGSPVWAAISVAPIDFDGRPAIIGVIQDITERKRAEEALSEANARLAKADRRKDEFLAMLAHELRNPLSVLGGASEILQRAGDVEPEVRRAQDAIQRQARHMARLVDDLLDVSRVTQGKIGLKDERVRVADLLGQAVEAITPVVHARRHKLFVSLPPDPLPIDGDPVRLTQIIANVLNNAAKYTPAGGEIHLSAERRGADVEIRVRDNGQGIDATLLPHVFDLFVQGERGSDRTLGGLGIGLTMARSLVEMHGGTIDAHSDGPGTGSEFVIVLPLAEAEAEPGVEAQRLERAVSRRILVVDDNPDAAEMMRTLLELDGNEVTAVHDGPAAIQSALAWRPDVALIDLGMPGMDGFEVARRFRAEPSLHGTVLVALTGYGQEEDIRRSREAGFHHHVTKSADFEPLRRVLDSIAAAPES